MLREGGAAVLIAVLRNLDFGWKTPHSRRVCTSRINRAYRRNLSGIKKEKPGLGLFLFSHALCLQHIAKTATVTIPESSPDDGILRPLSHNGSVVKVRV